MKVEHDEPETVSVARDREIVIENVIILAVIFLWLIGSAFLLSG